MIEPQPVTVIVVDDQTVVREGLVLLVRLLSGIEVVGAASNGEDALRLVAEKQPDVVLMDLRMPRMDGVEATRRIRADYPDTQVVVLTTYSDEESVFAGLRAGARGYLTKDATADDIERAVGAVHGGDVQFDPAVQRRLADAVAEGADPADHPGGGRQRTADRDLPDGLTGREAEVLRLIAEGRSNREIADSLFITEATVKTHINNLFAKAGLRDRAQAVTYAFRHGLATVDSTG